jgi:enoyl-CoA hydratase/carnithine racemase
MRVMYEQITYFVEDPVAVITLNRPHALNAWTRQMDVEVRSAVLAAERDPKVVGIIITGAGRGFCAGADMKGLAAIGDGQGPPNGHYELEGGDFGGRFTWLLAIKKPVIAAINGPVAGMAVPLILCCDIRFIAENAPIVTSFSHRGLVAEWGIAWLLPRLVGAGNALDLLFSSRRLYGAEAAAIGLAQKALPAADVVPHSVRYVQELAAHASPWSLAIMKEQVYTQLMAPLGSSEARARELMLASFARPDFQEGVRSFVDKHPPNFDRVGG